MQIRKEVQAVIYNRFGKDTRVLLVKKLDSKNFNYRWRLLKGGVETGETDIDAVKREIMEEVGFRDILVEKKIYSYDFDSDGTLHQITTFAVKTMSQEPIKVQTEEIIDAGWVPKDQAIGLLFWPNEREAVKRVDSVINQKTQFLPRTTDQSSKSRLI
jgi:8-oxo-dGTP pyrophosphatase MutT (NUDIX family)